MGRLRHGEILPANTSETILDGRVASWNVDFTALTVGLALDDPAPRRPDYDFMFPELAADPAMRLAETPDMGRKLFALASIMSAQHGNPGGSNSGIPAAFTYFGQFLDHDITLEQAAIDGENLPLDLTRLADAPRYLSNARTCALDLDSLYGAPAPRQPENPARMRLGQVSTAPPRPALRDLYNDLPRQGRSLDPSEDRAALIGDPRNDENLIVAQLHVAFLRAHNAFVDEGATDAEAKSRLRAMYQSAVFGDFLPRILDAAVFDRIMDSGPRILVDMAAAPFVPLEFSAAGFRFGHSMIRADYDINGSFGPAGKIGQAPLSAMFTLTAMSGNFNPGAGRGFDTLPENWLVEWRRLLPVPGAAAPLMANGIDTTLSPGLDDLRDEMGVRLAEPVAVRLAARNLLRGFRFGLPTGQAIATALGFEPLAGQNMLEALPLSQRDLVRDLGFHDRTPLWFYLLAEAGDARAGKANGKRLGEVGSTIVGETLHGLAQATPDSIIPAGGGRPELPWTLLDILRKGGVA